MSQKFCDVFPTVTLPEQYGTLADMITVDRIVSTRQKDMLKVYITCERLIEKQDIFEIEKELRRQLFSAAEKEDMQRQQGVFDAKAPRIKIYETFRLSGQ